MPAELFNPKVDTLDKCIQYVHNLQKRLSFQKDYDNFFASLIKAAENSIHSKIWDNNKNMEKQKKYY